MNIDNLKSAPLPLLSLGFRPFFAMAGLFSVLLMLGWVLIFQGLLPYGADSLTPVAWHGHEMVYGYAMAVVAGFLLTAVTNWTGLMTAKGHLLAIMACVWAIPRIALAFNLLPILTVALFDVAFEIMLCIAVIRPIVQAGQWRQLLIVLILTCLIIGNCLYYASILGWIHNSYQLGLNIGVYLIIALILTIGRRVLPFFIEKGIPEAGAVNNSRLLDISGGVFYLGFVINMLFIQYSPATIVLGLILAAIHTGRLWLWHHRGIWSRPMLWSIYLAYFFITLGFLMTALEEALNPVIPVSLHLLAVGGVGMMTLGMMVRVSLGHTGRNVRQPPFNTSWLFGLILVSVVARSFGIQLFPSLYTSLIVVAQITWILSFTLFIVQIVPMLFKPRTDDLQQ